MTNFKADFDEALTDARRAVLSNSNLIREFIPSFYSRDFDRLTGSISDLLELVDKEKIDHPEYLAHSSGSISRLAVDVASQVQSSFESGAGHFVQNSLPSLLLVEERLLKATGNYYYKVRNVKDRQVREIGKLASESMEARNKAIKAKDEADEVLSQFNEAATKLGEIENRISESANRVEELRKTIETLASDDGRGKSLEALKRHALKKIDDIEDVVAKGQAARKSAEAGNVALKDARALFDTRQAQIDELRSEAELVLGLSNQAGLASSYMKESQKLNFRSLSYTVILYIVSGITAAIAAFYVLPNIEASVRTGSGDMLSITLLRATILAPLVYVIYFTTKQISSIETLRMDYAEKAAASLAYSGYKGEMSQDQPLLESLRGSLLMKFAEHPERLLRKHSSREGFELKLPNFRAFGTTKGKDEKPEDQEIDQA